MFIMTADGWKRIICTSATIAPADPPRHSMQGWKERGYKSFIGWVHNDMTMADPTQDF